MRLTAAYNWPEKYAKFLGQMRVRLGSGPSGEAAAERRAIEVLDVFADPRSTTGAKSPRSWVSVVRRAPAADGDAVLGAVTFYFRRRSAVSAETRQSLRIGRRPDGGDGREGEDHRGSDAREHRAQRIERDARAAVRRVVEARASERRVPCEHLARAAHAAHGGDGLHRADAGRRCRPRHRRSSSTRLGT